MHIFISHCVREPDSTCIKTAKRDLISNLKKKGFSVFDYVEGPNTRNDWMEQIQLDLCNSSALVYFVKQWPESDPGWVLLEIGAAYMMKIETYFFYKGGYQSNQPIFSGYSGRFNPVTYIDSNRVAKNPRELLDMFRGTKERTIDEAGRAFLTLTDVFIRHKEPTVGSSLDKTAIIMKSIHTALLDRHRNGLGLRQLEAKRSYSNVAGYWYIPSPQVIVAATKQPNGHDACQIMTWHYVNGAWTAEGDFSAARDPSNLLERIYTIGYVRDLNGVCLLCENSGQWCLLAKGKAEPLTASDELRGAIRRTFIRSLDDVSGFFADGRFYRIDLAKYRICVEPTYSTSVVFDEFYSPPLADAPARLASIHGATDWTALVNGGRVEAVGETDADRNMGGVHHFGGNLSLGTWKPISRAEVLRCLRTDSIDKASFIAEKKRKQIKRMTREDKDAFEWYRCFICEYRRKFTLSASQYNRLPTTPLVYECDGSLNLFEENSNQLVYHELDFQWKEALREKVWKVIGHGVLTER